MLSKLSVKKPYTVLVGVILILVLGVLSIRDMSTDLLPDMELPYAIVITTYPGASPEEVERGVTRPVEQAMASISNMKNVSSMSNSNVSIVILEFNEGADMNTATIDMRESLDNISSQWDDMIGNPTIMKINPDMMPIMVAAIDCEGLDAFALTEKMETDILPDIESVEGVASVTTSGQLEKKIEIIIQQDKIDIVNKKVKKAIKGEFKDASAELEENQEKLEEGQSTLEEQQELTAEQLAQGEAEIDKNVKTMDAALNTINDNLTALAEKETTLIESEKTINTALATLATTKAQLKATIATLTTTKEQLTELTEGITKLKAQKEAIEGQIAVSGETTELRIQLEAINAQLAVIQNQLTAQGMTEEDLFAKLTEVETGLTQATAGLEEINTNEKELKKNLKTIKEGKTQIASAKVELEGAKAQLEAGQLTLEQAKTELSKQTILAAIKLSVAQVEVSTGSSKLDEAEATLKDTEKTTTENADLSNLITKSMVEGILAAENFEMPAGYITEDDVSYLVKVGDEIDTTTAIEDLVICDMGIDNLKPIRLSDVADVIVTDNANEQYTIVNGNPAISVTVEKATGYSTGDVTDKLLERFELLEHEVEGLRVSVLMDQGVYIDMVVDSVVSNLISGGVLAILILFLFLKDLRPTLIVACSIPLSVVAAIVLMYFSNVTLNIISLSGLALGVGMLVDNSVVVIENIFRMRNEEGYDIKHAAIEGAKQVAGAITSSTLTTIFVFAPIIFTDGITKQIFVDLALTLGYSLLASLLVSLTLVPAMAQGMLRKEKVHKDGILTRIQNGYGKILSVFLHKKAIVLLSTLALLILFVVLAFSRGTAFMPEMRSTQMTVTLSAPEDVPMTTEELYDKADQVMEQFLTIEDVETVGSTSGGAGTMSLMSGSSGDAISMYILLNEETTRDNNDIKKEMEEKTKDIGCTIDIESSAMDMTSMMGSGISIQVRGKDLDKLQTITTEIIEKVQDVEGIETITNGMENSEQEFRVTVNKEKAMKYSLTVAQVFQQISAKLQEASSSTTISTDTDELGVYVSNNEDSTMNQKELKNMKITYTDTQTQKTKEIKLSKIADFTMADSPVTINRVNQNRYMTVSITIDEEHNIGLVSNDVNKALEDYQLPAGYTLASTGEDETINESMEQLVLLIVVGILFMYLIMVAQFQSLLSPFIVLFTIPLAFTGGFMGLYFSGSEISIIAMIGFVMLAGIIVNNGIVLVDYINQLRASGISKHDAIIEAGVTRLRPILMTAITTVLGLIPMLVTTDSGSDMVKPMSIVTVGGLVYGTLLTLFVVPCIYDVLNRKKDKDMIDDLD